MNNDAAPWAGDTGLTVSGPTGDSDTVMDRIACAFAACASSEIRTTMRQVLHDLAVACDADCAVFLKRSDDQRQIHALSAQEFGLPAETWARQIFAAGDAGGADDLPDLEDWRDAGGTVRGWRLDGHSVLLLRWNEDAPDPRLRGIASLLRRAGALITTAMKRENVAEERRNLLHRLSESQKLDVAGTTAVAMAHNLNNVLAAILGQTEIALGALRDQPRGYNAVMAIRNASERAAELIESILGFGQRDIASERVSMARLIVETIDLLRPAMPERITITFDDSSDEGSVYGRAAELQQVLLNLLRNSTQAIPNEGRISVRIDRRHGHGRSVMQIGALEEQPYLVIEVEDSGVGIDPESYATIFRPFHTTRPAGSGLGLSTVADIVSGHNGAIRISKPSGHGTMFEVWLPMCTEGGSLPPVNDGTGQPVIVIARETVRERFEDIVAALGYEPEGYNSIDVALAAIADDPLRPCAVILRTECADVDCYIVLAERFRPVSHRVPLAILMPGRMSAAPLGLITGRLMWLAGSDNSSAIAACMRQMANAAANTQGAMK